MWYDITGSAIEPEGLNAIESNRKVFASADETACDFLIDDYKVEVGGKRKITKQADFVLRDDIDIPDNDIIPLWMLGFEY